MKSFVVKIFLFVCAVVSLIEGMFLFMVGLGRVSTGDIISFYSFLLQTPNARDVTLGFAAGFLFLGFILLAVAFRGNKRQKSILIKEKGQILRIPQDAVKDFIDQILGQNPYISDFDTTIHSKAKQVHIDISPVFNDSVCLRQEVGQIRRILRDQIARVFEFSHFKINFQIKSISVSPGKEYFSSEIVDKDRIEDEKPSPGRVLNQEADGVEWKKFQLKKF